LQEGNIFWRCNAEDGKSVSDYADPYYFQMDSTRIHNATLSYDSSITEGASIYVEVNVTINKWNTNDIFSNLTYNGTDYTSSKELLTTSADEDVYKFYNTLIVPDVGGATTLTGYWNFTLLLNDGTTEINDTYSFSQTVEETALFACDGTTNSTQFMAYNFTLWEETNNTQIQYVTDENDSEVNFTAGTIKANFLIWINNITINNTIYVDDENITELDVCVSPVNATFKANAVIEYYDGGYDKRNYYLDKSTIAANTTNTVPLYILLTTRGTGTTVYVQDSGGTGLSNHLIFIQRYYPETDTYTNVAMGRTDDLGNDYIFLRWYDVLYRFVVVDTNGVVVHTSIPAKISGDTITLTVQPETLEDILNEFDDVTTTLVWDNATKIARLTWVVTSGSAREVCLRCIGITATHPSTLYDLCETSVGSTLSCKLNESGINEYSVIAYGEGDITNRLGVLEIIQGIWKDIATELGIEGIAYTLLLSGTLAGMGLAMGSGVLAIGGVILGILFMSIFGFIKASIGIIMGIVIVALIAITRLRKL